MEALDELIKLRKQKVKLMQEDGDKSHQLLTNLYSNPTHFITELIQNAEDESAKNICFILKEDRLIFTHDSKRLFNFDDIKAISNFGDNEQKRGKPNVIGKFGIGFKSVYSITDNPRIRSGKYDITILEYNIPTVTKGYNNENYDGTEIILPFKEASKKKIYKILHEELKHLNLHYLLFLTKVEKIQWIIEKENGQYERIQLSDNKHHIVLKNASDDQLKYYLLKKNIQVNNKDLILKIAIKLSSNNKFVPCDSSPLFVFFPTKIETNLNFLIDVPFHTTPTRENVKEGDDLINIEGNEINNLLRKELMTFIQESLLHFMKEKLLNIDLLNIYPLKMELSYRSQYYEDLYNAVLNLFKRDEKLIPTSTSTYASASDSIIPRYSKLIKILNQKQTQMLFGRKHWVNKEISQNNPNSKIIFNYLRYELGVPEYDLNDLVNNINSNFLIKQSDRWLINFYKIVYDKLKTLYGWREDNFKFNLIKKPIIRAQAGKSIKQIEPFDNDNKPNVFLPVRGSNFVTVKESIYKNRATREFLKYIGLTTPDIFAEINKYIIPKFKDGHLFKEYYDDIKKIIYALQKSDKQKAQLLIKDLRSVNCIAGKHKNTGEVKLLKYYEVYYKTELLQEYFSSHPEIYFCEETMYRLNEDEVHLFKEFLSLIGVSNTPNRQRFSCDFYEKRSELNDDGQYSKINYCYDYTLDGLDAFFKLSMATQRSIILWKLLIERVKRNKNNLQYFLYGEYSYTKRKYDSKKNFEAAFIRQLKETKWLYNGSDFVKPEEISLSELPTELTSDRNNSETLAEILGFKSDEIQEYLKRTGAIILNKEEKQEWEKYQRNKVAKDNEAGITEPEIFDPEYEPNNVEIKVKDYDGEVNTTVTSLGQTIRNTNKTAGNLNLDKTSSIKREQLDDIGKWGQNHVNKVLNEEYPSQNNYKINDLNSDCEIGIGCDFIIKKGDEDFRFIEVKSTTCDVGHPLSVSKRQWNFSKNLYFKGEGDRYYIYCVFNAGTSNTRIVKICNPYKLWKDGKLDANPIEIIIRE